jgi:prepilin-type N-terminal cleavage/methylation domain-containing protein
MITIIQERPFSGRGRDDHGFSLIELMVAMSVFLIISVTAFTLFSRHQSLLGQEQGVSGLNIGLRNALSQLQIDVVNAGNGQILGPNVPAWPVGVTIVNSNPTASACYTAATFNSVGRMLTAPNYASVCFDSLNIVMVDANTPPVHPMTSTGGCINTTGTTLYGGFPSGYSSTTYATNFKSGDLVLLVSASSPTKYTTTKLTAAGTSTTCATLTGVPSCSTSYPSGFVSMTFSPTAAGGTNDSTDDPLLMTQNAPSTELSSSFCSTDWVLRLQPITYTVATSNTINGIEDPQLVRTQAGTSSVLMDQVVGFKVGAAWWNNDTDTYSYCYNTGAYCDPPTNSITGYNGDFTLIRSVRVTIIGRTTPSTDPAYTYRNPFDSGAYQIRGSSIVVDPRNLTMGND